MHVSGHAMSRVYCRTFSLRVLSHFRHSPLLPLLRSSFLACYSSGVSLLKFLVGRGFLTGATQGFVDPKAESDGQMDRV